MEKDQIRIIYNGMQNKVVITDSCPYWDFKMFKDWLEPGKRIGTGYCKHPLIDNEEIECRYGETEIKVPDNCPLKKSQLITKIELVK